MWTCSLYIAQQKHACTHMLKSTRAHPPSKPHALTCPHVPATTSIFLRTPVSYVWHAQTCMYSCWSAVHIVQKQHACNWSTHAPIHAGAPQIGVTKWGKGSGTVRVIGIKKVKGNTRRQWKTRTEVDLSLSNFRWSSFTRVFSEGPPWPPLHTVSRDTVSHLHLHVVPRTISRLTVTLSRKEHSPRINHHYVIQIQAHTKRIQHTPPSHME